MNSIYIHYEYFKILNEAKTLLFKYISVTRRISGLLSLTAYVTWTYTEICGLHWNIWNHHFCMSKNISSATLVTHFIIQVSSLSGALQLLLQGFNSPTKQGNLCSLSPDPSGSTSASADKLPPDSAPALSPVTKAPQVGWQGPRYRVSTSSLNPVDCEDPPGHPELSGMKSLLWLFPQSRSTVLVPTVLWSSVRD